VDRFDSYTTRHSIFILETLMSDGGKGSSPRPFSVDQKTFDDNWDKIFNRKKQTDKEKFDRAVMKDEYYDLDNPTED
jgi:hypothetical protein